jgi:dolichol-phosphate mannosyltransferase
VTYHKAVVVIPTYNEAKNLVALLPEILQFHLDVLVVDDGSADGTAEVARNFDRVRVLSRPKKMGLGSAYIEGFSQVLKEDYDLIIQMDADGSHRADDLKKLLEHSEKETSVDLFIGSRWVRGGKIENWSRHREILSRGANRYSQLLLGSAVRDMTSGFRIYRTSLLRKMELSQITSQGYGFQIEMTREAERVGGRIVEVPITFIERTIGKSKMSSEIVFEAMVKVTLWGLRRLNFKAR